MSYSISSGDAVNGRVVITIREWDGVDRPSHIDLDALMPQQAQSWAQALLNQAAKAASWQERDDEARRLQLIGERTKLQQQIDELDRKIATRASS